MDLRVLTYVLVALVYVGYPMYLLMTQPTLFKTRILGLGLMVYGVLGAAWPGAGSPLLVLVASAMVIIGFGAYRGVVAEHFLWLLLMIYSLVVLLWPDPIDPLAKIIFAVTLLIGFDRCMQPPKPAQPEAHH